MLSDWRVRWATAAVFLGLGAALLAGAGAASADSTAKHSDDGPAATASQLVGQYRGHCGREQAPRRAGSRGPRQALHPSPGPRADSDRRRRD